MEGKRCVRLGSSLTMSGFAAVLPAAPERAAEDEDGSLLRIQP
jgi:hypothetical protein